MSKDYKLAVFIGRFQPIHKAHLEVIEHGLKIADQVVLLVGSAYSSRTVKNPFTFDERWAQIELYLDKNQPIKNRVHIDPLEDHFYNENAWITEVQNSVRRYAEDEDGIVLIGNYKDASSYYLKHFPQWDFQGVKTEKNTNATDIRELMFSKGEISEEVPEGVRDHIFHWMYTEPSKWDGKSSFTENMSRLQVEYLGLKEYKDKWKGSPFPPTFVTSDSIVTCSGHVLVVKRKFNPGQGLYALPGGFVKQDESVRTAALRELKEETRIKVDKIILDSSIVDEKVFDHPDRSLRGRTITHAFHIKLKDGKLPEVKGGDDASGAEWLSFSEVLRKPEMFFEDHYAIINYFLNGN